MKKQINEFKKTEAIHAVCEGLTQTQVEKLKTLAESVEFTTEEEFGHKLETLVDSYFQNKVKSGNSSALNEEVLIEDEPKTSVSGDPAMAQYASAISKTVAK
jgi:translation initiation factor 2 alpha subunit (eIF-2alpha)